MRRLHTTLLSVLGALLCLLVQQVLANVFASNVRVVLNGGAGVTISFVLSDHADSVVVKVKSGATVIRSITATNYSRGDTSIVWDGMTDGGTAAPTGTYSFQIITYDKGYGTYTQLALDGRAGLSSRGVTTITNPALKNFGFTYTVDNNGYQGAVGAVRYAANMEPWGNVKDSCKLTTTGLALGPSEARWSSEADKDGFVYVLARTGRQMLRYHTDSLVVSLADTGFGGFYANGIAIREETSGKTIALTVNNSSGTATIAGTSKILAFHLNSASDTHLGGAYDTLVTSSGKFCFWDATFGRDSVLYATFIYPGDTIRSGIAKFDLAGKTHPLTMADTSWTVRVDSGRVSTCAMYFGTASDGSQDILYFVNARIASGNPPNVQGIYAVTNLNSAQGTRTFAYPDPDAGTNASITRSDVAVDAVGNLVYFENSNEEVSLVSPPTGPNSYTLNVLPTVKWVAAENISSVRVDANADGQPDRLNDTVNVVGVINGVNLTASANRFQYTIQDNTGGIVITKGSETGGGPVYNVGDQVSVTGTVAFYNGLTEINLASTSDVSLVSSGNTVTPIPVTIDQLLANGETYESRYVELDGVAKTSGSAAWPSPGSNATMTIWDGYKSMTMFIDLDTDVDDSTQPAYPMNLKGVVSQYTSAAPYNTGYEIIPQHYADIAPGVAVSPNPHFAIVAPANNATFRLDSTNQNFTFSWNKAVDLNGDAVIYQWVPIGGTPVVTGTAGADTFLVRTGTQLKTFLGANDTVLLKWTVYTKDPSGPIVHNSDTLTVKIARGTILGVGSVDLLPKSFAIEQNYPNPFNPSTKIQYALPTSAIVTLKVYNVLGQEVETLVNGLQSAGYLNAIWNGRDNSGRAVSSGVYFYRIVATSLEGKRFEQSRKMLLLK